MKLWVFHSQLCVSMKTGTEVHKAIDMAVVKCLSEKMHYQLSNLSPPTADRGAGVRRHRRWKSKMPEQPETGMVGPPPGRMVRTRPEGSPQDRASRGCLDSHPGAGGLRRRRAPAIPSLLP